MFSPGNIILLLAATTTALIAGLFYAWTCSVTVGLSRLPNAEYIAAMQAMNRAIQNPLFFVSFFGTLLLLPLSVYWHYEQPMSPRFLFLLAATVVYGVGGFGFTVLGNIPLNEALDAFDLTAATEEAVAHQRAMFENPWNRLNTIRTIASTVAIMLVTMACLCPHKTPLVE